MNGLDKFMFGMVLGALISLIVCSTFMDSLSKLKQEAVDKGYAVWYADQTNGVVEFKWKADLVESD